MIKAELFERSAVRCIEKATNGGLKAGQLGLLTSKKGLGKTSVLVQFGLDDLFKGKQVFHVSFAQQSSYMISWYQDIFAEIAKKKNISNVSELLDEVVQKRVILNFNQDAVTLCQVVKTVKALAESGIKADCLIIDGVDFSKVSADSLKAVADYAKENDITVWFSATCESDVIADTLADDLQPLFACVLHLAQKADAVEIQALKLPEGSDSAISVRLDSKTLLMTEK